MKQKKIVFLFGGPGAEHEVSVATAKSALPKFDAQYSILPVFITKDNAWVASQEYMPPAESWAVAQKLITQSGIAQDVAIDMIEHTDPYVVFIGLHGTYGEDGTLQALLESHGLAFTGSNAEASSLAMDKPKVLQILQDEEITVPEFLELTSEMPEGAALEFGHYHGFPVVVLPADSGSSVGVTIVRNQEQLPMAIDTARQYSDRILLSQFIPGREVSCGMLVTDKNELTALPPTELIPNENYEFFDYDAKYKPGATKEITPPHMDDAIIAEIKSLARRVHHLLEADGYSRTDMIVGEDGKIYVLELNTLPGLTETSILPQQAAAFGLNFTDFLTTICENVDRSSREYLTAV
nr:D-alanine--D-alanine ligase [uncultured bacterium]